MSNTCEGCSRLETNARDVKRRRLDTQDAVAFKTYAPLVANATGKGMGVERVRKTSSAYHTGPTSVAGLQRPPTEPRRASNPYPGDSERRRSVATMRQQARKLPSLRPPPQPPMSNPEAQARPSPLPTPTVAPHFNSQGELIQPSPTPSRPPQSSIPTYPRTHAMRPRHRIRLCAQHGCAAILPQKDPSDICVRCRQGYSGPWHELHRVPDAARPQVVVPSQPMGISEMRMPRHVLVPTPESGGTSSTPILVDDTPEEDFADLELLYPEPSEEQVNPTPRPPPSGQAPPPLPPLFTPLGLPLRIPPRPAAPPHQPKFINPAELTLGHPASLPTPPPSSSQDTHPPRISGPTPDSRPRPPGAKRPPPPPPPPPPDRICASPSCTAPLQASATTPRCFGCVMKDWKARRVPSNKRRKTVTWADEMDVDDAGLVGGDEEGADGDVKEGEIDADEDEREAGPPKLTPMLGTTTPKIKIRIPGGRGASVNASDHDGGSGLGESAGEVPCLVEVEPGLDAVGTQLESRQHREPQRVSPQPDGVRPQDTQPVVPQPDKTQPQNTQPASPKPSAGPSPLSSREEPPPITISGWDSDLTDLSDLSSLIDSDDDEPSTTTGLKIRIPARPKPPSDPATCTIKRCGRVLPKNYQWKCCVPCRLHHREYQRKRQGIQGRHTRLDVEVALHHDNDFTPRPTPPPKVPPSTTSEELLLTPGARLCSIKNCTHVIPAREEYKWKMCEPCRVRTRNNRNRIRRMNMGMGADASGGHPGAGAGMDVDGEGSGSDSESEAVVGAERRDDEGSSTGLRRCQSLDCGMRVDIASSSVFCGQCTTRLVRSHRKWGGRPRSATSKSETTRKPSAESPYPEYKCWSALLDEFRTRITCFFEAQSLYLRYKQSLEEYPRVTSTFGFEGEFSVVALDFDVLGRREVLHRQTIKLKDEMARAGGLEFKPTCWQSTPNRSIVTRFACVHRKPQISQPLDVSAPQMHGELEIAVLPDHSHMLFPGQRTIVRFRLLG
ncbi:hypothetical protein FPV67DRAFT_1724123 [Lyophyllum atratum]|nr:hypothetical protein FPV67DRAFT_1724123 [Lyophyllum atratum]